MLVTTRYQVDQGKQPQFIFKQLTLVQTHQRHKGKEPMSIQSHENIPEALFDPSSDLIEMITPLESSHIDMDMNFTMDQQMKNISDEYYVDLLSGDATHESRPPHPLLLIDIWVHTKGLRKVSNKNINHQ